MAQHGGVSRVTAVSTGIYGLCRCTGDLALIGEVTARRDDRSVNCPCDGVIRHG